jgi:hypothetical protein
MPGTATSIWHYPGPDQDLFEGRLPSLLKLKARFERFFRPGLLLRCAFITLLMYLSAICPRRSKQIKST